MNTRKVNNSFKKSVGKWTNNRQFKPNRTELRAWATAVCITKKINPKLRAVLFTLLSTVNLSTGISRATKEGIRKLGIQLFKENRVDTDKFSDHTIKRHVKELSNSIAPYFIVTRTRIGHKTYSMYHFEVAKMIEELVEGEHACGKLLGKNVPTKPTKQGCNFTDYTSDDFLNDQLLEASKHQKRHEFDVGKSCELDVNSNFFGQDTKSSASLDISYLQSLESEPAFESESRATCTTNRSYSTGELGAPSEQVAKSNNNKSYIFNETTLPTPSSSVGQLDNHVVEVNKKVECEVIENVIKEDEVSNFKDMPHSAVPSAGATGSRERLHQQKKFLVEFLGVSEEKAGQLLAWWSADQIKGAVSYMKERQKHAPISDKAAYFDKIVGKVGVCDKSSSGPSRAQILQNAHKQIESTKMTLVDKMKSPDMQELARLFEELLPEHKLAVYDRVSKENALAANARTLWGALACSGTAEIVLQAARDYGYI